MTLHFSELFKITKGKIEPRFKLSFAALKIQSQQNPINQDLDEIIDLQKHTNSYFKVVLNNGVHNITKIYLG